MKTENPILSVFIRVHRWYSLKFLLNLRNLIQVYPIMIKLQEKIQSQAESVINKEEALLILEGRTSLLETLYKANREREKYFS